MTGYHIINIKYEGKSYFAVWYTLETEGVLCKDGKLMLYTDASALRSDCIANGITPDEGISKSYDLDALSAFVSDPDCFATAETADYWSLFNDIAFCTKKTFAGDGNSFMINDIYEKLCMSGIMDEDFDDEIDNLGDDRFDLSDEEEDLCKAVLKTGLEMFAKNYTVVA